MGLAFFPEERKLRKPILERNGRKCPFHSPPTHPKKNAHGFIQKGYPSKIN
jgi:hypothetical protein